VVFRRIQEAVEQSGLDPPSMRRGVRRISSNVTPASRLGAAALSVGGVVWLVCASL